jgi:type II secretory pathway pseudopilin PulG
MKGFTLIETIIYFGVLTAIIGAMVVFTSSLLLSDRHNDARVELVDNSQFVLQRVSRVLRGAQQINSPAVGAPSSATLSINTASTSLNPFIFDVANGALRLKVGSQMPVNITTSGVTLSSVSFQNFSFSGRSKNTVRFRATFRSVDPNATQASLSLDTFLSIR